MRNKFRIKKKSHKINLYYISFTIAAYQFYSIKFKTYVHVQLIYDIFHDEYK